MVSVVTSDSRAVTPGAVFVAIRGEKSDGHRYVEDAFARGAALAIVERGEVLAGRPGVIVADGRVALSRLAALFAGEAARQMTVIGITGTNGKTTTNWLLYHALRAQGCRPLRIGTLGMYAEEGISLPGDLTTPGAEQIHRVLAQAFGLNCRSCVIEASSHALQQHRLDDMAFDVALFTNLTRDHLDYHKDMESYYRAKMRLFELLEQQGKGKRLALVNVDNQEGQRLYRDLVGRNLTVRGFGVEEDAWLRIEEFGQTIGGSVVRLAVDVAGSGVERAEVRSPLIGAHNAQNIAGAAAVLVGLGSTLTEAAMHLSAAPAVPGRLPGTGDALLVPAEQTEGRRAFRSNARTARQRQFHPPPALVVLHG